MNEFKFYMHCLQILPDKNLAIRCVLYSISRARKLKKSKMIEFLNNCPASKFKLIEKSIKKKYPELLKTFNLVKLLK
jgi:hypothetical protein